MKKKIRLEKVSKQKISELKAYNTILITGASSGIGASLAYYYAKQRRKLILWGRSEQRLEKVAQQCRQNGGIVFTRSLDLINLESVEIALKEEIGKHRIDLAILAAGSGSIKTESDSLETIETLKMLMKLNYAAPCLMANMLARQMMQYQKGHIVLLGSVAAFHSLPFATGYSSSKAGLARFADALRLATKQLGIQVTLISPGFIDTPMSQRLNCSKPFLMPLEKATRKIVSAIKQGKNQLILPWPFTILKWIDMLCPAFLKDQILTSIKVKQKNS